MSPLICFVYIVEGIDGWCYCGITSDLSKRLFNHNNDNKKYKALHRPFHYVYLKRLMSRKEARYYEKAIKAFGVKKWYKREEISGRMDISRHLVSAFYNGSS